MAFNGFRALGLPRTVFKWQEGFWQKMKKVFDAEYKAAGCHSPPICSHFPAIYTSFYMFFTSFSYVQRGERGARRSFSRPGSWTSVAVS